MIHYSKQSREIPEQALKQYEFKSPDWWKAYNAVKSKRQTSILKWLLNHGYEVEIKIKKEAKVKALKMLNELSSRKGFNFNDTDIDFLVKIIADYF